MKTPTGQRGRPAHPSSAMRLLPIATRITPALMARLRQASKASGWNVSVEIRHRLAKSFDPGNTLMQLQSHMRVSEVRAKMELIIVEILDRDGAAPSRDQLLQAGIPVMAIDTLFRSVLIDVMRRRASQRVSA